MKFSLVSMRHKYVKVIATLNDGSVVEWYDPGPHTAAYSTGALKETLKTDVREGWMQFKTTEGAVLLDMRKVSALEFIDPV